MKSTLASRVVCLASYYWTPICLVPICVLASYQTVKPWLGWHFDNRIGQPETVQGFAVLCLSLALLVAMCLIHWHRRLGHWTIVGAMVVSSLGCVGILFQTVSGSDIHANMILGWRKISIETVEVGTIEMIETWNGRANPRIEGKILLGPDVVINQIEDWDIRWAVGSAWDRLDLSQNSNRMYTHPPGMVIFLANWFELFGQTTYSALAFVLVVKWVLLTIAAIWVGQLLPIPNSQDRTAILMLFATAPPVLLHNFPANNDMATLLSMIGIALAFTLSTLPAYLGAGVLIGLAAYTHFFHTYLIAFALALFIFSKPAWKSGKIIALGSGMGLTFGVFTWLGYYPWLTYLTGRQFESEFRDRMEVINRDLSTSIFEYSYLGIPLIILFVLSIRHCRLRARLENRWMIAVVLTIGVGAYTMFGFTNGQRYLIGFFFLLTPLLGKTIIALELRQNQIHVIPLVGIAFTALVVFF